MILVIALGLAGALALALLVYAHYSGENPLLDALYDFHLRSIDIDTLDRRNQANPRHADVTISLTTLPSRIHRIAPTIKSLLNQTVRPAKIRLNVPAWSRREQKGYEIPEWLGRLHSLTIVPCDDFGPATKLIPTLGSVPSEHPVVVVDDDRIYHPQFLEQLLNHAQAHPSAAIAASGWDAPPDLIDRPSTLSAVLGGRPPVPLHCTRIGRGREVDLVRGASGYLVRGQFFDLEALSDYRGAPEAAFFVDDVWISAHCRAAKLVLPGRRTNFMSKIDSGFYALSSLGLINCTGADVTRNNTIMLQYFAERWRVTRMPRS